MILNPNPWSCMSTSFAMALGMPFALFLQEVGHDGSEIIFDDGSTHRGFHIQECIDVCLKHGFACTEIQGYFGSIPFVGSPEAKPLYPLATCVERFDAYLKSYRGVLTGFVTRATGRVVGHAVYWDGTCINDPRGRKYDFTDANDNNFNPQTFWILTRMCKDA